MSKLRCSFCNKTEDEVRKLAAGPNVYICDECVKIAAEIMEHEVHGMRPRSFFKRLLDRFFGSRFALPPRRAIRA